MFLGENKISTKSGIRFIKLLFRYSQPEAFNKLAGEMLQVLPVSKMHASPAAAFYSASCVQCH